MDEKADAEPKCLLDIEEHRTTLDRVRDDGSSPSVLAKIEGIEANLETLYAVVMAQSTVIEHSASVEQVYSGPLPHPNTLREYEVIVSGAGQRILAMAEREQAHRHRMDVSSVLRSWGGLIVAGVICGSVVVGGVIILYQGKSAFGFAAILAGLLPIVGAFLSLKIKTKDVSVEPVDSPR